MTHLEKLYRQLAPAHKLSVEEVERICRYQFAFVAEQMGLPHLPSVRLPYLGVFKPLPSRLRKLAEIAAFEAYVQETEEAETLYWQHRAQLSPPPVHPLFRGRGKVGSMTAEEV